MLRSAPISALLAALLLVCVPVAHADEDDAEEYGPYTSTNFYNVGSDFSNLDDVITLGQSAGYPIPGIEEWLAIELDFAIGLFGGENSGGQPVLGGGGGGGGGGLPPCTGGIGEVPGVTCDDSGGGGGGGGNNNSDNRTQSGEDLRFQTIGLYAAFTTPGKFFFSGKIGVNAVFATLDEVQDADGLPYKVGIGYRSDRGSRILLEYTQFNDVLDGIGLSLRYGFSSPF